MLRIRILFTLPLLVGGLIRSNIIRVPDDQTTIQGAIVTATPGDTVLVAPGRYEENINFSGKDIVVASHYILENDSSLIDSTIIDGSNPLHPDTASCVLFISGETSSAVLKGFTITGGTGTRWIDEHGAGTYFEGGGILITLSSPTISYNKIVGNTATRVGAGITSAGGGGIRCGDGSPVIENNVIESNTGMYGGGIVMNFASGTITNNLIVNNTVYQAAEGYPTFGGGGVWVYGQPDETVIEGNTVVGNSSVGAGAGGGIRIWDAEATLTNNIIWNNRQSSGGPLNAPNATVATYNNIEGGWEGEGNINLPPLFCNPDSGQYTLAANSPCLGSGENGANMGVYGAACETQLYIKDLWIESLFADPDSGEFTVITEVDNPDDETVSVYAVFAGLTDSTMDTLGLYDDGNYSDELPDDDIWGGYWDIPEHERTYSVRPVIEELQTGQTYLYHDSAVFTTVGPMIFDGITSMTDSLVEPGDLTAFGCALKNLSTYGIAYSVSAILQADHDCVESLVSSEAHYGDISAGESVTATRRFAIKITESCSGGFDLPITVDIYSDNMHFWTDSLTIPILKKLAVGSETSFLPDRLHLYQNYPNPFNPITTVTYDLPFAAHVTLGIYDVRGVRIKALVKNVEQVGLRRVTWDGTDDLGKRVSSGVYFYRMEARSADPAGQRHPIAQTRKMVFMK